MLKHVGLHNNRKVVIVFRQVPDEKHMSLVTYTDLLPSPVHDDLIKAVEGNAVQSERDAGNALHRITGSDGQMILHKLHKNGWIKKVRAEDIILRPQPGKEGYKLSEINEIMEKLDAGGEAATKLADLDQNAGMADPQKQAQNILEAQEKVTPPNDLTPEATETLSVSGDGVLSDEDLANDLVRQADQMRAQVSTLNNEIDRLMQEAQDLNPKLKPAKKTRAKKAAAKKATSK